MTHQSFVISNLNVFPFFVLYLNLLIICCQSPSSSVSGHISLIFSVIGVKVGVEFCQVESTVINDIDVWRLLAQVDTASGTKHVVPHVYVSLARLRGC